MKHEQKPDWKLDLFCFGYGCQKWMSVDFLNEYVGPPNGIHYWE